MQRNRDFGRYLICMCWLFGHRWDRTLILRPNGKSQHDKAEYPNGYESKTCELCSCIEERPLEAEVQTNKVSTEHHTHH